MIGKMAIATALRGLNDLGHSVTPTFLSRNIFYLQRSTQGSMVTQGSMATLWFKILE